MAVAIWLSALLLYGLFRFWYDGFSKPLQADEIERFMALVEARQKEGYHVPDLAELRQFLESDDGREFVMYNLLQFADSPATDPETGESVSPRELLNKYLKPFMGTILRRAGHPVITGQIIGGYIDEWGTPPNPGWQGAGLVRYRSRRDAMLASLANPHFFAMHKYKAAAIQQTYAIPASRQMGLYASPRLTVALVLALLAALLHLAIV